MFAPGETITHKFRVPFVASEIKTAIVSYKQGEHLVLEKTIKSGFEEDDPPDHTFITVLLTQGESLLFKDDMPFTIQINIATTFGTRSTSREMSGSTLLQHVRDVI